MGEDLVSRIVPVPLPASDRIDVYSGVARLSGKTWAREVRSAASTPKTAVVFIHPTANFMGHYALEPLAQHGIAAFGMVTRYVGNDSALFLENCAVDIGAMVSVLRQEGFANVVLVGNSGGGGLVPFFQAQAEDPTVTGLPTGGGPDFTTFSLPPADGIILLNAHPSRAMLLSEWIDPAILNEADPFTRDPELDLFAPGRNAPFDSTFVETYRAAQVARSQRITQWVWDRVDSLSHEKEAPPDLPFVVHGTAADPRFLDLQLDPSDREVGTLWGDARTVNFLPTSLGRYSSLRSWLSQWSLDDSQADAREDLKCVSCPVLLIASLADKSVFPAHTEALWSSIAVADKQRVEIRNATHYFEKQPEMLTEAIETIVSWLETHGFG